jgi:hypothetical protein
MKKIIRKILKEEKVPQPGVSSNVGTDVSNMKPYTKYLNINEILDQIDGIPYYKEVLGDIIKNDYSWDVTKKVLEYGEYLKSHPESISKLPPIKVIDDKLGSEVQSVPDLARSRRFPEESTSNFSKFAVSTALALSIKYLGL